MQGWVKPAYSREVIKLNIDVESEKWIFAKTYAKSNPHEYIVRSRCHSVDFFDALCEYIKNNGHIEYFYNHCGTYVSIGDYTYWQMGDVINRRWNDMYIVNPKTKQIEKVKNWKELLQW